MTWILQSRVLALRQCPVRVISPQRRLLTHRWGLPPIDSIFYGNVTCRSTRFRAPAGLVDAGNSAIESLLPTKLCRNLSFAPFFYIPVLCYTATSWDPSKQRARYFDGLFLRLVSVVNSACCHAVHSQMTCQRCLCALLNKIHPMISVRKAAEPCSVSL